MPVSQTLLMRLISLNKDELVIELKEMPENKKKIENAAEKTGEAIGKGVKRGAKDVSGFGKGIKKGLKKEK